MMLSLNKYVRKFTISVVFLCFFLFVFLFCIVFKYDIIQSNREKCKLSNMSIEILLYGKSSTYNL